MEYIPRKKLIKRSQDQSSLKRSAHLKARHARVYAPKKVEGLFGKHLKERLLGKLQKREISMTNNDTRCPIRRGGKASRMFSSLAT